MATFLSSDTPVNRQLLRAVRAGNLERVGASLREGADPNIQVGPLRNPLLWVAHQSSSEDDVVELLLAGGADPASSSEWGSVLLMRARTRGPDATRAWIERFPSISQPALLKKCLLFCTNKDDETFQIMLEAARQLPASLWDSGTRLNLLAGLTHRDRSVDRFAAVWAMLDGGDAEARVNAINCLAAACSNGNASVVRWLLERGVSPTERDRFDRSAYQAAVEGNQPVCLRCLPDPSVPVWESLVAEAVSRQATGAFHQLFKFKGLSKKEQRRRLLGIKTPLPSERMGPAGDAPAARNSTWNLLCAAFVGPEPHLRPLWVRRLLELGFADDRGVLSEALAGFLWLRPSFSSKHDRASVDALVKSSSTADLRWDQSFSPEMRVLHGGARHPEQVAATCPDWQPWLNGWRAQCAAENLAQTLTDPDTAASRRRHRM